MSDWKDLAIWLAGIVISLLGLIWYLHDKRVSALESSMHSLRNTLQTIANDLAFIKGRTNK